MPRPRDTEPPSQVVLGQHTDQATGPMALWLRPQLWRQARSSDLGLGLLWPFLTSGHPTSEPSLVTPGGCIRG